MRTYVCECLCMRKGQCTLFRRLRGRERIQFIFNGMRRRPCKGFWDCGTATLTVDARQKVQLPRSLCKLLPANAVRYPMNVEYSRISHDTNGYVLLLTSSFMMVYHAFSCKIYRLQQTMKCKVIVPGFKGLCTFLTTITMT